MKINLVNGGQVVKVMKKSHAVSVTKLCVKKICEKLWKSLFLCPCIRRVGQKARESSFFVIVPWRQNIILW